MELCDLYVEDKSIYVVERCRRKGLSKLDFGNSYSHFVGFLSIDRGQLAPISGVKDHQQLKTWISSLFLSIDGV